MMNDQTTPTESKSPEGSVIETATTAQRAAAIETAFDYRGDVTITIRDGHTLEGYIFDRRLQDDAPSFRMMLTADGSRRQVALEDVVRLNFSGRDPAAGRSWETWIRKYAEKLAAGEKASLEPQPLGDEHDDASAS